MPFIGFFVFLIVIGLLYETAKKRGEFGFTTTKEEQKELNERGQGLWMLLWIPTGIALCNLLSWLAGGIQEDDKLVVYGFTMVAAGIPAGLLAFGANVMFEHIDATRIQKSIPRKR